MKTKDDTNDAPKPATNGKMAETPEQWWARISPSQRMLARQIALMMDEVTESKRIEIRKEAERIRARFIHLLRRPEKGCVSAIILPERFRGN